jgi:UDP-N-acetylglucosamine 2-epimerase (non-hydrolysing)
MRKKIKVMVVFGTRPEAIKMAPVIRELDVRSNEFETRVCATAQHRLLQDEALKIFKVRPDIDLNIMRADQHLYDVTTQVLIKMKDVMEAEKPDYVLVQGDTTTAFSASLAAFYEHRKIGHLEAGLRTYQKESPFPEEANRSMISNLTDYHFAPTEHAQNNLLKEGFPPENITVTGNTVIDALYWALDITREKKALSPDIEKLSMNGPFILVTAHRRESFGQGFKNICMGLKKIAREYPGYGIVYPVHLNPNVQKPVHSILGSRKNIHLIEPLDYISFVQMMKRAKFIISDSGGIQEEATALGKPVLVMRDVTERPEAVEAGVCKLVGTDPEKLFQETALLIEKGSKPNLLNKAKHIFGDGRAAERIVDVLFNKYSQS